MKSDRRATALPRKTSAIKLLRTDVSLCLPLIAKPLACSGTAKSVSAYIETTIHVLNTSSIGVMTRAAEKILSEALALEESDRATLAGLLIESLDEAPDEGWEEAWAAEIRRRVAQLDSGDVNTIPWEEVRARLLERKRGASEA